MIFQNICLLKRFTGCRDVVRFIALYRWYYYMCSVNTTVFFVVFFMFSFLYFHFQFSKPTCAFTDNAGRIWFVSLTHCICCSIFLAVWQLLLWINKCSCFRLPGSSHARSPMWLPVSWQDFSKLSLTHLNDICWKKLGNWLMNIQ